MTSPLMPRHIDKCPTSNMGYLYYVFEAGTSIGTLLINKLKTVL